jgi:hypothetical protein
MRGVVPMWREYEADYGVALKDGAFVRWREAGQQKVETLRKCAGESKSQRRVKSDAGREQC